MDLFRHHKDRAAAFLAKGKKKHALKEYRFALEANPGDVQVRQKLADLLLRLGYEDAAIREYQHVAGKYAADGFLVKAMAICKVILRIDPNHTETQEVLADLFATQNPNGTLPPSMTAALAGPSLRVTPARPVGTRATKSTMPAARVEEGFDRPPSPSPAPRAEPQIALPQRGTLRLDEIEAALVPHATPGLVLPSSTYESPERGVFFTPSKALPPIVAKTVPPIPAAAPQHDTIDEPPPESDPSSGVWATSTSREDDPATLLPGIFGAEQMPATAEVIVQEDVSEEGEYLELDEEDDLSGDVDLGAQSALVDTGEMSVNLSKVPPIPLFSQLDRQAFIALFQRLEVKSVPRGQRLITEGQTTRTMYIVAQGEVRVFRESGEQSTELARLGDGSFFGEIALLSSSPRMASVETTESTILFEMTRDDVAEIVKLHPSVSDVLSRFYRERFLANLVRSNPMLFAPLSDDEKRAVFQHFQSVTVAPGTVLLTKGEMGQGLYLILRGECDVTDEAPDGRELSLPKLREGDFFGEMSLLLNTAVTATVRARSTCVVLRLPPEVFYEKVMRHAEVRRVMTEVTNERLKQAVDARYAPDDPVLI